MRGVWPIRLLWLLTSLSVSSCLQVEVNSAIVKGGNLNRHQSGDETVDNLSDYLDVSELLPFSSAATTESVQFGSDTLTVITEHPASLLTGSKKDLGCYYIGPEKTVVCTQKVLGLQSGFKIYGTGWQSTGQVSLSATNVLPQANIDLGKNYRVSKNSMTLEGLTSSAVSQALTNKWVDIYPVIRDGKIWADRIYVWGDAGAPSVSSAPYLLVGSMVPDPSTLPIVTPNDEFFDLLWALGNSAQSLIRAEQSWRYETDCREKVIGVLDTGTGVLHPDLAANLWTNPDRTSPYVHGKNFIDDSGDVDDDNGHGTHVSGIIGAVGNNTLGTTGVCWRARIMALKILDQDGSGAVSDFVEGISFAAANHVDVLNVSLGVEGNSTSINDSVRTFLESGGVLVAAAGNGGDDGIGDNDDTSAFTPSNYTHPISSFDNVISVASIDGNSALSSFSNYGVSKVDLAAPGGYIDHSDETSDSIGSTYLDDDYAYLSGTSMAAPYVTGAVALYWSVRPMKTAAQVKMALLSSVTKKAGLSTKVKSGGQLNLEQFLLKP